MDEWGGRGTQLPPLLLECVAQLKLLVCTPLLPPPNVVFPCSTQYRYGGAFKDVAKNLYKEGGVLRFYRGYTAALLQGAGRPQILHCKMVSVVNRHDHPW